MNTLKSIMVERGVTAAALARATGAPYPTILAYTSGVRGIGSKHLMKIACTLDCQPADLLPGTNAIPHLACVSTGGDK